MGAHPRTTVRYQPDANSGRPYLESIPQSSDPTGNGPYGMCAKCHDLNQIMTNTSFSNHADHINQGVSCSVCHSAHGMEAPTPTSQASGW